MTLNSYYTIPYSFGSLCVQPYAFGSVCVKFVFCVVDHDNWESQLDGLS